MILLLNDYQEFYLEIKLDENPDNALYLKKKLIMKVYKVFMYVLGSLNLNKQLHNMIFLNTEFCAMSMYMLL